MAAIGQNYVVSSLCAAVEAHDCMGTGRSAKRIGEETLTAVAEAKSSNSD
jgi:hypothetical protein